MNPGKIFKASIYTALISMAVLSSCKKDDPDTGNQPVDTAPATYSFSNVDYSGQTVRLLLTDTLISAIEALEEAGASPLTKAQLEAIYNNTGDFFATYATGKNLSDKMQGGKGGPMDLQIRAWFDTLAVRSSKYAGSPEAVTTADGLFLPELIEKTIMGGVFYSQALNYMYEEVPVADNSNVTEGKGTAMQHNWDEAFGYFGAARDYTKYTDTEIAARESWKDANNDGKIDPASERNFYFARYAGSRDKSSSVFTSNSTDLTKDLFGGFTEGRYQIGKKDYTKRDAAREQISAAWDKVIAASAIKYAIDCKNNIGKPESLNGRWAEMKAFLDMTQVNKNSKLGAATYAELKTWAGNKPADATAENMEKLISTLKTVYGF